MQTATMRAKLFNVRFSDEEWQRLEALTGHLGLNAANLIRMLLKEKARELGVEPTTPEAPRPRVKRATKGGR